MLVTQPYPNTFSSASAAPFGNDSKELGKEAKDIVAYSASYGNVSNRHFNNSPHQHKVEDNDFCCHNNFLLLSVNCTTLCVPFDVIQR